MPRRNAAQCQESLEGDPLETISLIDDTGLSKQEDLGSQVIQ